MGDPAVLTASEAADAIATGHLEPEDLVRACLARIEALDGRVRAFVHFDGDRALAHARALRAPTSRLHGLPVGVKDMIDTADMPTQHNSPIYQGHRPAKDAAVVAITRALGGIILGKTDTHEFAAGGRLPATTNPHDPERTPGGSSSGSAAAVAAGEVSLAFGTQTGGSMLRPASFCGIFGMKPTFGTVSREGAKLYSITLDTIGWYGREVADLALMAEALRAIRRPLVFDLIRTFRFGLYRMPGSERAEPEARDALDKAATLLSDGGHEVTEFALPGTFDRIADLQLTIMKGEGRAAFLDDYLAHYDLLADDFRNRVEDADGISFDDLRAAQDAAAACRCEFDARAGAYDAVLAIGAAGVAPKSLQTTGDAFFQRMWSVLQVPCLALPGFAGADGMPMGVQLIAPRYRDATLLEAGHAASLAFHAAKVLPVPEKL